MAKVFVTGGTGFVGSHLVDRLLEQGHEVYSLTRKKKGRASQTRKGLTEVWGGFHDAKLLAEHLRHCDWLIHCAGVVAGNSEADYEMGNRETTSKLVEAYLEAAKTDASFKLKTVVHLSSLAAAGPDQDSVADYQSAKNERIAETPVSAYGRSKLAAEKEWNRVFSLSSETSIAMLRPPIVYGPRDRGFFTVIQTVKGRMVPIIQGKKRWYSAIYVEDLVRAIIHAAESKFNGIAYVSYPELISFDQMTDVIAKALKVKVVSFSIPFFPVQAIGHLLNGIGRVIGKSFPLNRDKLHEVAPVAWTCRSDWFSEKTGFQYQVPFELGITKTVTWLKERKWI